MSTVVRALKGVHWYLRELTGEAQWDRYVAHCEQHGHQPVSRREFERRRSDAAELDMGGRCC